jgi:XTP/dITP diphosphohydrolase
MGGLIIATNNAGKVAEFRQILAAQGHGDVVVEDLSSFPDAETVAEDGDTFLENAALKAVGYARITGMWALADDSGLCVDALAGKPGIHSARWAEAHGAGEGDADNSRLLRQQLRDVPEEERTAHFVCALVLADSDGRVVLTSQGRLDGRVINAARGRNGFGYDPIFWLDSMGRTAAQLEPAEKHAISHRGQAMTRMATMMREYGLLK